MAIREITMCLPEELLQSLDETIEERNFTRDEVLIRLVEDYVQRRGLEREIAEATLARLKTRGLGFYGDLTYHYLKCCKVGWGFERKGKVLRELEKFLNPPSINQKASPII